MKKSWILLLALLVAIAALVYVDRRDTNQNTTTPTNEVITEQPTENTNETDNDLLADLIRSDVQKGDLLTSPFVVTGSARGNWYFEASFPVQLLDANGNELVSTHAEAQSDWMTTDFVDFQVTLTFAPPTTKTGTLVLKNDNPSGDPARDKFLSIPVRFAD